MYILQVKTVIGEHLVLWRPNQDSVLIEKIGINNSSVDLTQGRTEQSHPDLGKIAEIIQGKRSRRTVEWALHHCDFSATTAWQQSIWRYLALEVPRGQVISYGGLAEKLGRPGAARSVGSCMAKNRFPLLIPCHRVVAGGGKLGGFMNGCADGLRIKRQLLAAEQVDYIGNTLQTVDALSA